MRVLVLVGGRSGEHEISILSGRFVTEALIEAGHEVVLAGIQKNGRWRHLTRLPEGDDPRKLSLPEEGPRAWLRPEPHEGPRAGALHREGRPPLEVDVAFPVLHGPLGEDGTLQGLFELCALPYVGSGVTASAACMDKVVQKELCAHQGLPLLDYVTVPARRYREDPDAIREACAALGHPQFVKPVNMGSSVGIARVMSPEGLDAAIEDALGHDEVAVVEQGLDHPREIELAVLERPDGELAVSIAGEIRISHPDGFYSYDAKYVDDEGATLTIPAPLSAPALARAQTLARRAFEVMGCRGLARVDLFGDGDALYLNEVNTMPGFTKISMYPALWAASGIPGPELVDTLVQTALRRRDPR